MANLFSELKPRITEIFEHLHANPEPSWREIETTAYIRKILEEQGCRVRIFDDCTGVVGDWGSGLPMIGVRADLDALWQEVDGSFRANHSCGHDAHMSMALGVLLALNRIPDPPSGTVRFLFQPAEEKGTGALKMIEKGALQGVTHLYGVHLRPIEELVAGEAAPAVMHGAGRFMRGRIRGEDAHGARPHLSANAIEVGAALVQLIQAIHIDPRIPHSAKMTRFQAGGETINLIPGNALFSLDLRAQTNDAIAILEARVQRMVQHLAQQFDVVIELETESETVAARSCPGVQDILAQAIAAVLGPEKLRSPLVTPGGEDFHYYTLNLPDLSGTILGLGCDLKPGLHHPRMTFRRESLLDGVRILTKAVLLDLNRAGGGGE